MNFGGHFTTHHADVGTVGYSLTGDDFLTHCLAILTALMLVTTESGVLLECETSW